MRSLRSTARRGNVSHHRTPRNRHGYNLPWPLCRIPWVRSGFVGTPDFRGRLRMRSPQVPGSVPKSRNMKKGVRERLLNPVTQLTLLLACAIATSVLYSFLKAMSHRSQPLLLLCLFFTSGIALRVGLPSKGWPSWPRRDLIMILALLTATFIMAALAKDTFVRVL